MIFEAFRIYVYGCWVKRTCTVTSPQIERNSVAGIWTPARHAEFARTRDEIRLEIGLREHAHPRCVPSQYPSAV